MSPKGAYAKGLVPEWPCPVGRFHGHLAYSGLWAIEGLSLKGLMGPQLLLLFASQ